MGHMTGRGRYTSGMVEHIVTAITNFGIPKIEAIFFGVFSTLIVIDVFTKGKISGTR